LAQGLQVAAAAGLPVAEARIRVLQADIQAEQSGVFAELLQACEAAAEVLESAGNLDGLAEALLATGRMRCWAADPVAAEQALQRAADCARQSGNHRAERAAGTWLLAVLQDLPITAQEAVSRAERLLAAAAGDPWAEAAILQPLIMLYGYAGRLDDARAACQRAQSTLTASGAELDWAICAKLAGRTELIAGDPAAAEQHLRQGYEALRAMGGGHCASLATWLAEAVYAQGRFGEALRLTEEAEALAGLEDYEAQGRWRATRAKALARRGQFPAATRLAEEAVTLYPATVDPPERAEFLLAKAEVSRLHGALDEAEACARRALQFYEDRQMVPLAARARALIDSLAAHCRTPADR
jgi:tetratricopeptide (TPR) repeat protein